MGRTGRLATDGHAFSFFTREMARLAPPVVELLEAHEQVGRLVGVFAFSGSGCSTRASLIPAGMQHN